MNRERIEAAIELTKQATNLDMECWQNGSKQVTTIEELHSCGNTACFAGYLVLSDEWKLAGGTIDCYGTPALGDELGHTAIANYLGINTNLSHKLIHGDTKRTDYSYFYEIGWRKVTPQHVIAKLELILNGELQ